MKMKSLMLMVVAVGCGLVAMLGVQQVLSSDRGQQIEKVRVLVALTEIDPGVPLTKENCAFREVPKEGVPEKAVTKPEEFEERAVTTRMFTNQVICQPQLGEKGVFGATINIPDGMRVVTMPVNATATHSGMMKPGDRVDVLATFQLQRPGTGAVTRTKTILEYIEVFATDQLRSGVEETSTKGAPKDGVKNVSLLVNLKQATVLKLAESKGTIHLALRSKTDTLRSETTDIDENNLESLESMFDAQANADKPKSAQKEEPETQAVIEKPNFAEYLAQPVQVEAPPAAKPTWKVTIYSGDEKVVEEVELPEAERPAATTDAGQSAGGHWAVSVGRFLGVIGGK